MSVVKSLAAAVVVLSAVCTGAQASSPEMPVPPGIAVRQSIDGPIFVDDRGMTLYKTGLERCTNSRDAVLLDASEVMPHRAIPPPDIETRRTCLIKHPPLHAPASAVPVGKWAVVMRDDGIRQWAYDGEPLYTSIKDQAPG